MSTKLPAPPLQEDVERRFRDILEHGEVQELSRWLDIPYATLNKQLNPNDPARSDFYKTVRLLWALGQIGEEKARRAVDLLSELVLPAENGLQIVNRMESDLSKLKARLTEKAA